MARAPVLSFTSLHTLRNGAHRIVWFGNVIGNSHVDRAIVVFSPRVIDEDTGEETFDLSIRLPVAIPVAFLREFRIGDIWEGTSWTGRKSVQACETFKLDISEATVKIMPIGVPLDAGLYNQRYVLPFDQFAGHRDHTQAQCARVSLADGSILVIPCMELVRFYFGASGSFLKRLFSGAFALDRLYTSAYLNPTTQVGSIDLAPDLAGVAAATVARIAFNSQAKSAARWVINSNVASSVKRISYYPKTTFPFFGSTNLTALGRWIAHGNERVFLAEQLLSCTHPFPFHTLYYSASQSLKKNHAGRPFFTGNNYPGEESQSRAREEVSYFTDSAISNVLQSAHVGIGLPSEQCFPDLASKKVRRVGARPHSSAAHPATDTPATLGGGEVTSTSDVRGAEITSVPDELVIDGARPPEAAEVFERAVRANQGLRRDYMEWEQIGASIGKVPLEAFVRGDAVVQNGSDVALQDVWAGLLQIRLDSMPDTVLVLIRDNISEDVGDHVAVLRIENQDRQTEIELFCELFAKRELLEEYGQRLIHTFHTQTAANLLSVLRALSMLPMKIHS